jgi:hypothetical protein
LAVLLIPYQVEPELLEVQVPPLAAYICTTRLPPVYVKGEEKVKVYDELVPPE